MTIDLGDLPEEGRRALCLLAAKRGISLEQLIKEILACRAEAEEAVSSTGK